MNWYYEKSQEQHGPITEEALKDMRKTGALSGGNLVWREGFSDWVAYDEVFSEARVPEAKQSCPNCGADAAAGTLIPAGETTVCPNCREDYLQRLNEGVLIHADSDAEAIRKAHIKHEASLKSVGLLYYFGAFFMLFAGISFLFAFNGVNSGRGMDVFSMGIVIFQLGFGVVMVVVGRGFRKLKRWIRVPGTIISVLGLLNIPIGTLINGYILYLIWSQKGKVILSAEYQDVIAATPDVKYKTPAWIIALLIVILVLIFFGFVVSIVKA